MMKREMTDLYAKVIPFYCNTRPSYNTAVDEIINTINLDTTKAQLQALDLGCGFGAQAINFAKKGFNVLGIDTSDDMLYLFKTFLEKENSDIKNKITLQNDSWLSQNADWQKENTYDLIYFLGNTIGLSGTKNNIKQVFSLISKILKPGGYFAFDFVWFHHINNSEPIVWAKSLPTDIDDEFFQRGVLIKKYENQSYIDVIFKVKWIRKNTETIEEETYRLFQLNSDLTHQLCQENKLTVIKHYDIEKKELATDASNRVLWIIRKDIQ
jgi:SAM-dependent methyltransferase